MFHRKFGLLWASTIVIAGVLAFAACQSPMTSVTDESVGPAAEAESNAEASAGDKEEVDDTGVDSQTPAADRAGAVTFTIVRDGTEARFYIDEVLMGNDTTVVGVTSLVEGELRVDPAVPAATEIGVIRIDARDLTTDSSRRNGAIRRFVLQSNQDKYQYITFTPTVIDGLPDTVTVGEPFDFSVTGELQIRDVVNPETFEMTVTANSETELTGLGKTTILRSDYDLTIPSVPSVSNVAEEVPLEIAFAAVAAQPPPAANESTGAETVAADAVVDSCTGTPTSRNQEGPYYSVGSPQRDSLIDEGMPGAQLLIVGRLYDEACSPISGAKVDFWQADIAGEYDNVGHRLRGHVFTDGAGAYAVETIEPGPYTGRPPHIHVKVFAPDGRELLTTQIYTSGSEESIDVRNSPDLLATYLETDASGRRRIQFDFVVEAD